MTVPAVVYSRFWRAVTGALVVASRGSVLVLAALLLCFETPLENPLRLLRTFATVTLAPGLAAWLLARAFAATVTIAGDLLVVQRRDQRIEIPLPAIVGVLPWRVPLPSGGVDLGLRSGRRFDYGLQLADPVGFAAALTDAGAPETVRAAAADPAARYQRSREADARRWYRPLLQYVLYALVPTLPVFRLHQWIAYGSTFGEYYTYGLGAYLLGFAVFWATYAVHLVLYAGVLRAVAEIVVAACAWRAPASLIPVRRIVERTRALLYYGAVPVFLARLAYLS